MKKDLAISKPTRGERSLLADTKGAGLVEYIILVGVIALAALAGFREFGVDVNETATGLGDRVRAVGD